MSPEIVAPGPPRSPWQHLYGAVLSGRRRFFATRAKRLPRPVVSIGNLHWGGGGKTPLVAATAAHCRDGASGAGTRVAILTRGYGGSGRGVRIASRGAGPERDARDVGDEPALLADSLPGVAIVVGERRYEAGRFALSELDPPPEIFLLDDGFSHVRLHRDIDILAFPAADPFSGGRLAPGGRLREPLAASRYADAVVLTGAPNPGERGGQSHAGEGESSGTALARALAPFGFAGPGFAAETVAEPARFESGEVLEPPARIIAVSALARNAPFHRLAEREGFEIVAALELHDHHAYPDAMLREIQRLWEAHDATAVLTTAKDHVKLVGRLDLPIAVLPIASRPEPAFWTWLEQRLGEVGRREMGREDEER